VKCIVCGKIYEGGECPRCQFPEVNFLGDPEDEIRKMQPTIQAFRRNLLSHIKVGVVAYSWKAEEECLVENQEEQVSFGVGTALQGQMQWLTRRFARIPDANQVKIRLWFANAMEQWEQEVTLDNLPQAELQELGAVLDDQFQLQLCLQNASGAKSWSSRVPLFP
jgi:hypothetical protein